MIGAQDRPLSEPERGHDVPLWRGGHVVLRPFRPDDITRIREAFPLVKPEDIYCRFHSPLREIPEPMLARLAALDPRRHLAVVALAPPDVDAGKPPLCGIAQLFLEASGERGEYAIIVRSDWKGQGVGYVLMQDLIARARARRVKTIFGLILRANETMLEMARELGSTLTGSDDPRLVTATLTLAGPSVGRES
jgi:acetyltransferase